MASAPVDISGLENPAKNITDMSISGLLTGAGFNVFDFVFFLAGLFFTGTLLISAFRYLTAEGDPGKISSSTNRITNALLGLVLVFTSFVIIKIAASIFGYGAGSDKSIVPF